MASLGLTLAHAAGKSKALKSEFAINAKGAIRIDFVKAIAYHKIIMAIQYIHASFISRSFGHNALAAAAYRANEKLYCKRTGQTFDYTGKKDCVYSDIILPDSAYVDGMSEGNHPFHDRETLWNAVEDIEDSHNRRASARLAMELKIALPKELSHTEQIKLATAFIRQHYVDKHGVAADICIHDKGDGNPHAHVMLTFRQVIGATLSRKKVREIAPEMRQSQRGAFCVKDGLNELWATFQNDFFEAHDLDVKVDQTHVVPTVHEGHHRDGAAHREKVKQNHSIKKTNEELVRQNPALVIDTLAARQSVFTDRDIRSLVFTMTGQSSDPQLYQSVLEQVMASDALIPLGYTASGHLSYTTRETYEKELALTDMAESLSGATVTPIHTRVVESAIREKTLNAEQAHALKAMVQSGGLACVVGMAGTGKTHLLGAVQSVYASQGITVRGIALPGKVSYAMTVEAGIPSDTLDRLLTSAVHGREQVLPPMGAVVVLDEAGLVGLDKFHQLMQLATERQWKLILVGDPDQLQPIARGAPFRAIVERVGFCVLSSVVRQRSAGDREATINLAQGRIGAALDHYEAASAVVLADADTAQSDLLSAYRQAVVEQPDQTVGVFAFRQSQVQALNAKARQIHQSLGHLGSGHALQVKPDGQRVTRELAVGDRVIFLAKRQLSCSVENGMMGKILSVTATGELSVKLDHGDTVHFSLSDYDQLDYAYALTVHKAQGVTVDRALVYASGYGWDRHMAYVAMSRHRESVTLYANRETYTDRDGLTRALSSSPIRDNVLDYPLQFGLRRGEPATTLVGQAVSKIQGVVDRTRDVWQQLFHANAYAMRQQRTTRLRDQQQQRALARPVAALGDAARAASHAYQALTAKYGDAWHQDVAAQQVFTETVEPLFLKRNALAHTLLPDCASFSEALSLNHLTVAKLTEWSTTHEQTTAVASFASQTSGYGRMKSSRAVDVTTAAGKREVTRQQVWQPLRQAQQADALQRACQSDASVAARWRRLQHYLFLHQGVGRYYHKAMADHFSPPTPPAALRVTLMTADAAASSRLFSKRWRRAADALPVIVFKGQGQPVDVLVQDGRFWQVKESIAWSSLPASLQTAMATPTAAYNLQSEAEQTFLRSTCGHQAVVPLPAHQARYEAIAKQFGRRAEAVAADMMREWEAYAPLLAVRYPDEAKQAQVIDRLRHYADNHAKRAMIRTYIAESTPKREREKAAYQLSQDFKGHVRLGDEEGLVWACVSQTAWPETLRVHRAALVTNAPDQVPIFDGFHAYQMLCREAAKQTVTVMEMEDQLKRQLTLAPTAAIPKEKVSQALAKAREAMYRAIAERHEAAYDLSQDYPCLLDWANTSPDQCDAVYPRFDGKRFARHVALHEARLAAEARVKQFAALHRSSPEMTVEKMALAYEMTTNHMAKHTFTLAQQGIDRSLIWHYALAHRYQLEQANYTGADQVVYRALADYVLACDRCRQGWQTVRQGERARQDVAPLKQAAFDLAMKRNALAYQASTVIGQYPDNEVFSRFVIEPIASRPLAIDQLVSHAKHYESVAALTHYQSLVPGSLAATQQAADLVQRHSRGALWHQLKNASINSTQFFADADAGMRDAYRKGLTTEARLAHDQVVQYVESCRALNTASKAERAALLATCRHQARVLSVSPDRYLDALHFEQVNMDRLVRDIDQATQQRKKSLAKPTVASMDSGRSVSSQGLPTERRPSLPYYDYARVEAALKARPDLYYPRIFGEPKPSRSTAQTLRFAGGVVVTLTDHQAGQWYDFSEGIGGGPIQALMRHRQLDFKAALAAAAQMVGVEARLDAPSLTPVVTPQQPVMPDLSVQYGRRCAEAIWFASQPIAGTLAERYMTEHRAIPDVSQMRLRFLPVGARYSQWVENASGQWVDQVTVNRHPAMVIGVTNREGAITGVQRTFLDAQTARKSTVVSVVKRSRGQIRDGALLQAGQSGGRLYIAEGIETGASLAAIDPKATVLISLSVSNMANLVAHAKQYAPEQVILLQDQDGPEAKTASAIARAVEAFESAGLTTTVKQPMVLPEQVMIEGKQAKTDWNDVLQYRGVTGLKAAFISTPVDHNIRCDLSPRYQSHMTDSLIQAIGQYVEAYHTQGDLKKTGWTIQQQHCTALTALKALLNDAPATQLPISLKAASEQYRTAHTLDDRALSRFVECIHLDANWHTQALLKHRHPAQQETLMINEPPPDLAMTTSPEIITMTDLTLHLDPRYQVYIDQALLNHLSAYASAYQQGKPLELAGALAKKQNEAAFEQLKQLSETMTPDNIPLKTATDNLLVHHRLDDATLSRLVTCIHLDANWYAQAQARSAQVTSTKTTQMIASADCREQPADVPERLAMTDITLDLDSRYEAHIDQGLLNHLAAYATAYQEGKRLEPAGALAKKQNEVALEALKKLFDTVTPNNLSLSLKGASENLLTNRTLDDATLGRLVKCIHLDANWYEQSRRQSLAKQRSHTQDNGISY